MNTQRAIASAFLVGMATFAISEARGDEVSIVVKADQVAGRVSRYLTGACIEDVNHEIYGGIYSQMIFGESFQEPPPSTPIPGFKTFGGRWEVSGDLVKIDAKDGPKLISDHASLKDGKISVEVFFEDRQGANAGLILQVNQPGIGADRWIGYEVSLEPAGQGLHLARHRNNYEPIKTAKCEVAIGRWIPLEVEIEGSEIEVYVDGKSVMTHDDGDKALPPGTYGLRGWHSQARFRNFRITNENVTDTLSFRQPESTPEVSGMWRPVSSGSAKGKLNLVTQATFTGSQSQRITFESGEGRIGIENQGLNRWGMNFVEGKPYEGSLWVRAERQTSLFASLESRDGSKTYGEVKLDVRAGTWRKLDFTITPTASDKAGRFVLALKNSSSVVLGHAFLQPGEWGRFHGLPVRRDVVEGLVDQGITVLRYGGSMVNNAEYRWKKMIGPRDRRPPYAGLWYRYSSNGWGILDFMDLSEAAGFEYIPDFCIDETPQDMADFIDYAKGSSSNEWARKRVADGRDQPYKLRYMELGNEERVDDAYAAKFEALAKVIWAKDRDVILVVGDFNYNQPILEPLNFTGADSKITNLSGHKRILEFARQNDREVWFDVHIDTDNPAPSGSLKALPTYIDALAKLSGGAKHKVVVFEYNSGNHSIRRALGNAVATNVIERDGRIPIVTSANGLQPDGQNDNGWDQGLLFLNPSQVWLQPPGYVTRMQSRNYLPQLVNAEITNSPGQLDVVAKRSEDGKILALEVVNYGDQEVTPTLLISGFVPKNELTRVTTLSGPLNARNTAEQPDLITPKPSEWKHQIQEGKTKYTFVPYSFTILRFE